MAERLTRQETDDLFAAMRASADPPTSPERERLILAFLGVARLETKRYADRGLGRMDRGDVYGECLLALVNAVDRFAPGVGPPFQVFATIQVRLSLVTYFNSDGGPLSLGRSGGQVVSFVRSARARLTKAGEPDGDEDVFRSLGWGERRKRSAAMVLAVSRASLPSDTPRSPGLGWVPGPEPGDDADARDGAKARVDGMLARLKPEHRDAVKLRLGIGGGEPMSFTDIAAAMGKKHRQHAASYFNRGMSNLRKMAS